MSFAFQWPSSFSVTCPPLIPVLAVLSHENGLTHGQPLLTHSMLEALRSAVVNNWITAPPPLVLSPHREKKQKIQDIRKNVKDAIVVSSL